MGLVHGGRNESVAAGAAWRGGWEVRNFSSYFPRVDHFRCYFDLEQACRRIYLFDVGIFDEGGWSTCAFVLPRAEIVPERAPSERYISL